MISAFMLSEDIYNYTNSDNDKHDYPKPGNFDICPDM